MFADEAWARMLAEAEDELKNKSEYYYLTSKDFAKIFFIGNEEITNETLPCVTTNVYFGEDDKFDSEYVVRLFRPFDTTGLIALANRSLGGKLFARECREDSEYDFIVKFLEDFKDLNFKKKTKYFYVDCGFFDYERVINDKYGIGS